MKRISLDDLLHTRKNLDYQEQYEYIMKLLEKGQIKPVKASKSNGKKPALFLHLPGWHFPADWKTQGTD